MDLTIDDLGGNQEFRMAVSGYDNLGKIDVGKHFPVVQDGFHNVSVSGNTGRIAERFGPVVFDENTGSYQYRQNSG